MSGEVGRRFGAAAGSYDTAASVQRLAASRLAARIVSAGLARNPRILEIGCGTGLLGAALRPLVPGAEWVASDLSPAMLERCRARLPDLRFVAMDAEMPTVQGGFDLVCGGMAMQWFADRRAAVAGLAGLLAAGGLLALSTLCEGSFALWRAALAEVGAADRVRRQPAVSALQAEWPADGVGWWQSEMVLERHRRGMDFLRGLRAIGADLPRAGTRPVDPLLLRRALRQFERAGGAVAEYEVGYGLFRRSPTAQRGVFVTGTDTGVGKTLVSACLVRAWGASYFKPLQTGLRDEPGDSETVARLAGLSADRVVPPCYEFQAPLAPEQAARLEGVTIDASSIRLPDATAPLVVEGAGGLMVPVAGDVLMIDLIGRLGLPVVLVARGTLGTINHTLLSLEALRTRGIAVLGVVLNGEVLAGNREAIERHARVLAELPEMALVDGSALDQLSGLFLA